MDRTIIVSNLVKKFEVTERGVGIASSLGSLFSGVKKTVTALSGVNFEVDQGELVGFIGPNGAGKTTTLKTLSGLLYPTSGTVQVLGYEPWGRAETFLKQISLVMGQKNQLWWDLPASETFELNRAIYEIPKAKFKKTLKELVTLLEVEDLLGTQVRRLSLGQRMRLELVASLLHEPKVLFLDEPTIGLDVVGQKKIRDFVRDYNRRVGATILLTSHDMDDLVDLTKRVIVIDTGSVMFDGKLTDLIESYATEKTISIQLSKDVNTTLLQGIGKITSIDMPRVTLSVPRDAVAVAAAEILQSLPIADMTIEETPIEDIIRQVFQKKKKGS